MITNLRPGETAEILPLNAVVQALHAKERPALFKAAPDPVAVKSFFDTWLQTPGRFILVDRRNGRAVGYASFAMIKRADGPFSPAYNDGKLDQIAVHPNWQKRGIGSGLIAAGRARLAALGCETMTSTYHGFNDASAALMAANGLDVSVVQVRRNGLS